MASRHGYQSISNGEDLSKLRPNFEQTLDESVKKYEAIEDHKRSWLTPLFLLAQCQLCTWGQDLSDINSEERAGWKKFTCCISVAILNSLGAFLQITILLVFLIDILFYRPVLFIYILTDNFDNFSDNENGYVRISPASRLYHEYEDYFLFVWDYIYGLIALCSTFFLFYYSWVKRDDHKPISRLVRDIVRNKVSSYKYKLRINGLKDSPTFSYKKFIKSSEYRSEFSRRFGWSLLHLIVIILSVVLVIYWIVVNIYVWMENTQSYSLLTQNSDLLFIFMIFDSFYWHLAPVLVCFFIRMSCIELTSKLNKLVYKFAWSCLPFRNSIIMENRSQEMMPLRQDQASTRNPSPASSRLSPTTQTLDSLERGEIQEAGNVLPEQEVIAKSPPFELWSEFYFVLNRVAKVANKFRWIAAINSVVLIFGVVGLSVKFIMSDNNKMVDFLAHDTTDAVRLIMWYTLHLISVWLMVDSMARLNLTLDTFTDDILVILAEKKIELTKEIRDELNICGKSKIRFTMNSFGTVTTSTANVILAFGGTTLGIFLTEAIQLALHNKSIH